MFTDGVAVITGAGSGIGEALARTAASAGMAVVLADIDAGRVERVAAEITAAGDVALAVQTDVADPAALDRLAAQTHATFGDVRLLVNNAGVETMGLVWEVPAELWERTFRINVLGMVSGVRAFAPRMLDRGQPAYIANVVSVGGLSIFPVETPYICSKHAALSFTEGLYLEMRTQRRPIHVSAVMPGPVATRIFDDAKGVGAAEHHHRAVMSDMLATGMPPTEAAGLILAGITRGDFWVSTHPELTLETARGRADYLANLALPSIADTAQAILGIV
jgi:NAD(P)-dependent dehydrogenase (short-subunit alcohol dehydrogenase family)